MFPLTPDPLSDSNPNSVVLSLGHVDLSHVSFEGRPTPSRGHAPVTSRARRSPDPSSGLVDASAPGSLPAAILALQGLNPAAYRGRPLDRRTAACLRALRAESEHSAAAVLTARPDLVDRALSTLLIGVTGFFRDAPVFDALRDRVLPVLRAHAARPRIWSLGCANGAELYSVAMLLADAGLLEHSELLGTDCRREAIAAATEGRFPAEAVAGLEPGFRKRFFTGSGSGWRIAAALRDRITWRVSDGTVEFAPGPWDIVLCRNLVIYLQPVAAEAMFGRIVAMLSPLGHLVVGKAERPPASLALTPVARCIFRYGDD